MQIVFIVTIMLGVGLIALLPLLKKKYFKKEEDSHSFSAKDVKIVADFDKIIGEPIPFRVLGKTHYLKPINMKEFVQSADAMAHVMDKLKDPQKMEGITIADLLKMYHRVISSVCDTISMKEINQMSQAQARAVFQLVYDHITGRITEDAQKKNKPKAPHQRLKTS